MLLSSLIIALVSPVCALPTAFPFDPKTALAHAALRTETEGTSRIARLAKAVDDAHCSGGISDGTVSRGGDQEEQVSWQITHEPTSDSYILAFASPPPEGLLELLAAVSSNDDTHLTPLPASVLNLHNDHQPMIYSPFAPYLETVIEATEAVSRLIRPQTMVSRWLSSAASIFGLSIHLASPPSSQIDVSGQGLGAVMALLASVRLSGQTPDLTVRGTLFSMPKVGDKAFSNLVDEIVSSSSLRLESITNGFDPVPSLPPPHYGLQHPSSIMANTHQTHDRGLELAALGRGRIEDAYGPYDGVLIGLVC